MLQKPSLHVVLYQPRIAANVGAIGRTCVATGAALWLVRPLGFHMDDRSRRRAGLDYWEHLDCRLADSWTEIMEHPAIRRVWLFSTKAEMDYWDARFEAGDALVFGPENRGLPGSMLDSLPGQTLRIPMRPEARSLNLSNAVAIGVYEALRQIGRGT